MAVTTNYGWTKPTVGGDNSVWGGILNTLFDAVDSSLKTLENAVNTKLGYAGGTLTGRIDVKTASMAVQNRGNEIGSASFDISIAQYFIFTLVGGLTIAFTNAPPANLATGVIVRVTNGGAFTLNWPGSVDWVAGTPPTLTVAGVDMLAFITDDGGVTWRGLVLGKDIR